MSNPQVRHLAAVGSSFAAGPGIDPVEDRRAMRSGGNYAHLLAVRLGAHLTDLTVSGATTATILDTEQRMLWRRFPPQIPQLPSDADLITVTASGNDLHYLGSMIRLAYAARLGEHPITRPLSALFTRAGGVPHPGSDDLERATAGLVAIIDATRATAPDARILLVDYLTILETTTERTREAPFDPDIRDELREIGHRLAGVFAAAADAGHAELVTMTERSRGHGVGTSDPWVRGFSPTAPAASFHPTGAGMHAVADAVIDHLYGPE